MNSYIIEGRQRTGISTQTMTRMAMSFSVIVVIVGYVQATSQSHSHLHNRSKRSANVMDLGISLDGLPNMLANPSFEDQFPAKKDNPWKMSNGFDQSRITSDSKAGSYSLKVSGRTRTLDGATQVVTGLKPGRGYAVTGYIKLLNENTTTLWQAARIQLQFTFTDSPDKPEYVLMALKDNAVVPTAEQTTCVRSGEAAKEQGAAKPDRSSVIAYDLCYRGFITKSDGWVAFRGDINAPMREFESEVEFGVNGPDPGIDFLLDDLKLVEVPEHPDWLSKALTETDRNRKTDFNISFQLPTDVSAADIDVEVKLKNHKFAFGTKVEDDCITAGDNAQRYQDFVYNVFNWATVGSYKWRFDKGSSPAAPDFSNAIKATDVLLQHGIKVRAHSILWNVKENVPDWVQVLSPSATASAVDAHVKYMINITKGRVEQWDVQNEMIHEHYYEVKLQNRTFTMDIFKLARQLDPNVRLYHNDYQAVTTGAQTLELTELVKRFRQYGAEINGIGIQGHTKDYVKPDPLMIWYRLNQFGQLDNLDVFVTEFDLGHNDDVIRADWYEDAMRGFFAHPALKGHIMWGFWNTRMRYDNQYLTYGPKFKFSEVASRYACLVRKEWTTKYNFNLGKYLNKVVTLRGYLGDYDVIIRKKGVAVQKETLQVSGPLSSLTIKVTAQTAPLELPAESDYIGDCISHRNQTTLTTLPSTSAKSLSCVSRKQTLYTGSISNEVSVACEGDEILTDCSSAVDGGNDVDARIAGRLGERMTVESGVPYCTAYIRRKANFPAFLLQAIARCCTLPTVTCSYRQAGPSLFMDEAMAEATCLQGTALGCAAYSAKSQLRGVVYRGSNQTSCVVRNGSPLPSSAPNDISGVMASAPCCTTGSSTMACIVVKSGQGQTQVSCPNSTQVMTSCSAEGRSYSAAVCRTGNQELCRVSGDGSAYAVATCCSIAGYNPTPVSVQSCVSDVPYKPTTPSRTSAAYRHTFHRKYLVYCLVFTAATFQSHWLLR